MRARGFGLFLERHSMSRLSGEFAHMQRRIGSVIAK